MTNFNSDLTNFNSNVSNLIHQANNLLVKIRNEANSSPESYLKYSDLLNILTKYTNTLTELHANLAIFNKSEFIPVKDNTLEIKIKYLKEDVTRAEKITVGDWIDLRASQDVILKQGEQCDVPLGVAMELPKGYEAWLNGRSSLTKKFGVIRGGIGIIDSTYCGDNDEWKFPVYAIKNTIIRKNDRICQFRIMPIMEPLQLKEVEVLGNPDRGGLGSTGVQ